MILTSIRNGPDLNELIPNHQVKTLYEYPYLGGHFALTVSGEIWWKYPGEDWEEVDVLKLALQGRVDELNGLKEIINGLAHQDDQHP